MGLAWLVIAAACAAEPASPRDSRTWGQRLADSTLAEFPTAWNMRKSDGEYRWAYTQGLVGLGLQALHRKHGQARYHDYVKAYVDHYVGADGAIRTVAPDEFNLDSVNSGKLLFPLLDEAGEARYRKAIEQLRRQLEWQPRTRAGVFWHKLKYPWQVWLDGLYMGAPFYAEYARRFGRAEDFDDVLLQFRESYARLRDPATGLLYHGWDESRKQRWADPRTGRSPAFWGRAVGWYAMGLVETLDELPAGHPGRATLAAILKRLANAVVRVQDPKSGAWYQVLDQGGREGNYLEASVSAMLSFVLMKGARLGHLEARHGQAGRRAYDGFLKEFVVVGQDGRLTIQRACQVAGLGGDPEKERYRDGSFEYYVGEKVRADDPKAVGPFIFASLERERPAKP